MEAINKHGLSRTIPEAVKRVVRKRYGFGCIICGNALIEYDHHDPQWVDATEHSPDGIVPLCPFCHANVTRGAWSREKVTAAMRTPKALQQGFSRGLFDVGNEAPYIKFAGVTAYHTPRPICFGANDGPLLIEAPEAPGAPFRLSGTFYDSQGRMTLQIDQNEWKASSVNWDVEFKGPQLTIREASGKVHLVLKADPPKGIVIDRIDMVYRGHVIKGSGDSLTVDGMNFTNMISDHNPCGIMVLEGNGWR